MTLTDAAVRAAKPRQKAYKLFDGEGLYLLVAPSGALWWRFKYRVAGVEKLLSLGTYPATGLKLARKKAGTTREQLAAGIDPGAKRKAEKAALADSFKAVSDEWLGKQKATLEPETVARLKSWLDVVCVSLGSRPIARIEPPELLTVLRRIEHRGKHETAHRTRATLERVFTYAIATGRAVRNPAADLRGALTPVKSTHFPGLTDPIKVGQLLRNIAEYQGQPAVQYALKLSAYVFVRPSELRAARWSDFDLDSRQPTWRIPAKVMKLDREHLVPLAKQVVELLRELQTFTGDSEYLFPALSYRDRPISDAAINSALRRMGYDTQTEHCGHGFRTTASTLLNEQGFAPDAIELQLAHQETDKTRGAYNRAQRLDERRSMMEHWANFLDGLRAGGRGKVVGINRKAR